MRPTKSDTPLVPYHHGKKVTRSQVGQRVISHEDRMFIAWDGEGINLHGNGRPQSYVLFGSSRGHVTSRSGLSTFDCLDQIVETGLSYPTAVHVGFAFGYDTNMIIASLAPVTLERMHRNGWVRIKKNEYIYVLSWAKGKWFQVSRYNDTSRITVRIFDIFSFFMCSAIKAWEKTGIEVPQHIVEGKKKRKYFTLDDYDNGMVFDYWSVEIQLYSRLAEELRSRVYNAGLRITQWYGPGALATFELNKHGVKKHMKDCGPDVRKAARFAYAGGRFELYKVGRVTGRIFGVDINSAYPHAISQLPSLVDGYWRHVDYPSTLERFGVYRVSLQRSRGFDRNPGPVFHRDKDHNVSFPWRTEGWYWSPETDAAQRRGATVIEGWEYVGSAERPFEWVRDVYSTRRDWKRRGIRAELALKLLLNSIYGKMAQRVGWDETKRRMPPFHQLEWAGWVTSYVRARLFRLMTNIKWEDLIAVETDGLYTTMDPALLNIVDSEELGQWGVTEYDEMMYVQSGLAWLHGEPDKDHPDGWYTKRRGLDEGTFTLEHCQEYLKSLHPKPSRSTPWPVYSGLSTRFVGLGQALASKQLLHNRHCVWSTDKRDISPGQTGKRVHVHAYCHACQQGGTAYEAPHDLMVNSMSILDPHSYPHSIPWELEEGHPRWRDHAEWDDDQTLRMVYQ